MKKLAIGFLSGVAGLFIVLLAVYWGSPVRRWESVGPVQVLTDGKEIWVFLQFDTWKRRPGIFVSSPDVVIRSRQSVIEINHDRVKVYDVKDPGGPTFGPNSSFIFHRDDHLFLMEALGLNRGNAVYRWAGGENPRFDRLGNETSRRILRNYLKTSPQPATDEAFDTTASHTRVESSPGN